MRLPAPSARLHSPQAARGVLKGKMRWDGGVPESRDDGRGSWGHCQGLGWVGDLGLWGGRGWVWRPLCMRRVGQAVPGCCINGGGRAPRGGGIAPPTSRNAPDLCPPPSDSPPGEPERRPPDVRMPALSHQGWHHQVVFTQWLGVGGSLSPWVWLETSGHSDASLF